MLKKKLFFLKSELQTKIANGIVWSFLGTFISRGFLFFTTILITDLVSVKEYGQIGLIKSIIVTFTMFSLASFGITATRYISIFRDKDKDKAGKILSLTYYSTIIISVIIFLGINLFSKTFAIQIINDANTTKETFIISIAILFSALNGFQNGALGGFEKFKELSKVNISNGLLAIPILYFGTKYYGVLGYCYGMAILFLILFLYSSYFLHKAMKENKIKFTFYKIKDELDIIKKFSIPSFLGGFIISPTILVCNNILVKSNNGFVNMGTYEAAFNFSIIAMTFNSMVGQVLYPFAIRLFDKQNKKFDFLNLNAPWLIGVFISLFLIFLPDVFSMVFDKKYHNTSMYKTVVFIAVFIIFISHRQGVSRNLAAANKMWFGFFDNLIWSIIAILFTSFLVDMGASGRALAFVFAYLLNSFIVLPFYANRKVIDKDFIYSIESILIWFLVVFSIILTFLDLIIYHRILILFITLLILIYIGYKWFSRLKKDSFDDKKAYNH